MCAFGLSAISVKLKIHHQMYFSIANVFHFIDTETEASGRLGNKQPVGRRAGIPTQDHLIPKCWAIKCHCLLEIFPARQCLDSIIYHGYID